MFYYFHFVERLVKIYATEPVISALFIIIGNVSSHTPLVSRHVMYLIMIYDYLFLIYDEHCVCTLLLTFCRNYLDSLSTFYYNPN